MSKSQGLSDLFRDLRGQSQEHSSTQRQSLKPLRRSSVLHPEGIEHHPRRNAPMDTYQTFLDKYDDLERFIDGFVPHDFVYYFREKSKECGYKYHISNMKRDCGIYKKLLKDYSTRELALMIEFIFCSEQDYIDKASVQPTIMASAYVNTIYRDALLWAKDEYVPGARKKAPVKLRAQREWRNKPKEERSKIGEW